jgi:hypothetical protein
LTIGGATVHTRSAALAAVGGPVAVTTPTLVPPVQKRTAARGKNVVIGCAPSVPSTTLLAVQAILVAPRATLGDTSAPTEGAVPVGRRGGSGGSDRSRCCRWIIGGSWRKWWRCNRTGRERPGWRWRGADRRDALAVVWGAVHTGSICLAAIRRPVAVAAPTLVPPKKEGGAAWGENVIVRGAPSVLSATLFTGGTVLVAPLAALGDTSAAAVRAVAIRGWRW